jgi:RHS repeat-associated protein
MTSSGGSSLGTIKYFPFGATRSGSVPTDKQFTSQMVDSTGLYYYNARYYDPQIGRFISADTVIQNPATPQCLNRYSYCLNNPLKYTDPSGHVNEIDGWDVRVLDAIFDNPQIYLVFPDLWESMQNVVDEYLVYRELREDERVLIERTENSDTIWTLDFELDPSEDDNDGKYNRVYFDSASETHSYRWNADPAWWGDPEWQRDWTSKLENGLAAAGRIAKGGVEICGGLIVGLFGVADLVVVTGGSFGFFSWFSVPSGLYLIGQGYNFFAAGVSDISLGTLNPPGIPWLL